MDPKAAIKALDPMSEINDIDTIECGTEAARHFAFDEGYTNLNHGSFGTYPTAIRPVLRHFQERAEARPDDFIFYEYPVRLLESRAAIASYLHAPRETCVFVPNATTGINTVLRNLVYRPGDAIIYFDSIYGACEKTVAYIAESTPATAHKITCTYPARDDAIISAFEAAVSSLRAEGKTPRVAIFDTVASMPGVCVPFEALTALCKRHGVLSCVDGAHGAGHTRFDLPRLDPDFFVSNCHKWLLVPRACAVLYVPVRNQAMMRSTLPTSHGFVPRPDGGPMRTNPLPPTELSEFETNFAFIGTLDNAPYLCVQAALKWRAKVTWGEKKGEAAIEAYCRHLAREGGRVVASKLGTETMSNSPTDDTLGDCNFSNVRLPLSYVELTSAGGDATEAVLISQWIGRTLVEEYKTFIPLTFYQGAWWVRLSSQIYLTVRDFEWGGEALNEICQRVKKGEWRKTLPTGLKA